LAIKGAALIQSYQEDCRDTGSSTDQLGEPLFYTTHNLYTTQFTRN